MNRSIRFKTEGDTTPTSWNYQQTTEEKPGIKFSLAYRYAFTDKHAERSFTPGPGNYKLPSDFGHYKKMNNN